MLIFILFLFGSFVYADGIFSRYYNDRFLFSIDVPATKIEQLTGDDKIIIIDLDFVKYSKHIPSKNFFNAHGSVNGSGISLKNKSADIKISVYGSNFLNFEDFDELNTDSIKEAFRNEGLNYHQFIREYYNGRLTKNIDPLRYGYNKTLFIYGNNIAYSIIKNNFYVVSYIENNKIYYKKVLYNRKENIYAIFEVSFFAKDKNYMDKILTEMVKSFKFIK
jgi:hypothetical protein